MVWKQRSELGTDMLCSACMCTGKCFYDVKSESGYCRECLDFIEKRRKSFQASLAKRVPNRDSAWSVVGRMVKLIDGSKGKVFLHRHEVLGKYLPATRHKVSGIVYLQCPEHPCGFFWTKVR